LSLVEAAYRPSDGEAGWLDQVAAAGREALDHGLGVMAYTFGLGPRGKFDLGTVAARGAKARSVATMVLATRASRERDLRKIYFETGLCSTLSEFMGAATLRRARLARIHGALTGIRDFLAIKGTDGGRRGMAVGVFLPRVLELPDAFREQLEHVGAHLAAAHRLASKRSPRSDGLPEATEAVLEPGGAIVHAEGDAQGAREMLRETTRRIDRARATREDGALAVWPALLEARWSLVDHFETDGRRYVVARRNAGEVAAPAVLSPREQQVVALSARGHTHKLVAYELGISASTVRTLETRAMQKLGVRSRVELIALVRATT